MTQQTQALTLTSNQLESAISNPGGVGTIEAYISAVYRMPMLTREEEVELGERMRDHADLDAARQLIMSHLRLVVSISRQYLGYGLAHADLIQEGNIGLMKAVRRFDPSRGVRLVSFAVHWIKSEIHEYVIRNWRLVKVATTKAQRKLFFNLRRMTPDGQTLNPQQVDDIARELNVRPQDVSEMEVRMSGRDMGFEVPVEDEDGFAPVSWLSDNGHQEPSQVLERQEIDTLHGTGLHNALADLDPRSRRIVQARWLQDDSGSTLAELGEEFGVSAERIRQIEAAAFKKLRATLSDSHA